MRLITRDERRARLARRHHLAPGTQAGAVAQLAGDLAGLHATDPATVVLAVRCRVLGADPALIERALYEERSVVRMLGMRRTMFVVPVELMPVIHGACTSGLVPGERRKLVALLEAGGIASDGDGDAWLAAAQEAALAALRERGEATAAELGGDVPDLGRQIVLAAGKKYEGRQSVASRVLFMLAAEGLIVRGRPLGSWTSSLNRWAPLESWLESPPPPPLAQGPAVLELVRRWLAAFGPGTFADLKWWTGLSARLLRPALTELRPLEVSLDGGVIGLTLDGDDGPTVAPDPWAALLPGLDPTVMGWFERGWYLGEHGGRLFDRTGNAGPTVWWDGRIVGGWGQRDDGEVVYRLLEDVGADALTAIEAQVAGLAQWVGPVRLTPRFRTPLERELTA